MREAPGRGTYVAGAANVEVASRDDVEMLLEAGLSPSRPAVVPGTGTVAPLDMVNENRATARCVERGGTGAFCWSVVARARLLVVCAAASAPSRAADAHQQFTLTHSSLAFEGAV